MRSTILFDTTMKAAAPLVAVFDEWAPLPLTVYMSGSDGRRERS